MQWYTGAGGGQAYGGHKYLGKRGRWFQTPYGNFPRNECWHPSRQPAIAAIFFILFAIVSALVMLSLFIGAVCGGMSDALDSFAETEAANKQRLKDKAQAELDPK